MKTCIMCYSPLLQLQSYHIQSSCTSHTSQSVSVVNLSDLNKDLDKQSRILKKAKESSNIFCNAMNAVCDVVVQS